MMSDNPSLAAYIKEVRMMLADSMDTLLNLESNVFYDDEEIIQINDVVELVDMIFDVVCTEKIKQAESEFLNRQAI